MLVGIRPVRRRWVVAAVGIVALALAAFVAYQILDSPTRIYYYRLLDDHTLTVGTLSGPGARVCVSEVAEASSTVRVTVRSLWVGVGPGTAGGVSYESEVKLAAPLGSRTVIDASSDQPVRRTSNPPQAVLAPACT